MNMDMVYKLIGILDRIATAYRRINFPEVRWDDLVIDIGSGNMPNVRANVICDFFEKDLERSGQLKIDRLFVWANADSLPFKDKFFDYSILSHILEHVENPAKVLDEVQRISKSGYIETPNSFYEFAVSHVYHLSRCTIMDGKLVITMKDKWEEKLGGDRDDIDFDANKCWWNLHRLNSRALLTTYRWKDRINYTVRGNKPFRKLIREESREEDSRSSLRKSIIKVAYWLFRPRKIINLEKILCCPRCKGDLVISKGNVYGHADDFSSCVKCNLLYKKHRGFWDFRTKNKC